MADQPTPTVWTAYDTCHACHAHAGRPCLKLHTLNTRLPLKATRPHKGRTRIKATGGHRG